MINYTDTDKLFHEKNALTNQMKRQGVFKICLDVWVETP